MNEIVTPTYSGPDRRRAPDPRPTGEDPTGRVDSLLFAKLASAQVEAEKRYLVAHHGPVLSTSNRSRNTVIASLNAKAEGLAEAMSILSGEDPVEIRNRSRALVREREARDRDGLSEARKALDSAS